MRRYVIFGPSEKAGAVPEAVFGAVRDGSNPNVRYCGLKKLYRKNFFDDPNGIWNRIKHARKALKSLSFAGNIQMRYVDFLPLEPFFSYPEQTTFIFCVGTRFHLIPAQFIKRLRKKARGARIIFYWIDSISYFLERYKISEWALRNYLRLFDAIYTYDRAEASAYGDFMRFVDIPLWHSNELTRKPPELDLYFCGRNKDRIPLLAKIYQRCSEGALLSRFYMEKCSYPPPVWNRNPRMDSV